MDKPLNNRAWRLVLPVLLFVLFSALLPMMTVVNYSVQDQMGENHFFWNGDGWFRDLLNPHTDIGARFTDALLRNLAFSVTALLIEVPLGIAVALCLPRKGWTVGAMLVVIALPMLIPWNVVGTIWQIFARADSRLCHDARRPLLRVDARRRLHLHRPDVVRRRPLVVPARRRGDVRGRHVRLRIKQKLPAVHGARGDLGGGNDNGHETS